MFLYLLKNVWIRQKRNSECVGMVMETDNGKTNDVGCEQRNTAYLCEKLVKGMIFLKFLSTSTCLVIRFCLASAAVKFKYLVGE